MIPYNANSVYQPCCELDLIDEHHAPMGQNPCSPDVAPRLFCKVPRVLPNQLERFEVEEVFRKNSRDMEVRYTLFRDRPRHERQAKFQQGCREGHVEVSHSSTGLILPLSWNPKHNGFGDSVRYGCDVDNESGKVHIKSSLILNGVCVRWRGWIDAERLEGVGCIEFDAEMAKVENELQQHQVGLYQRRLREFELQNCGDLHEETKKLQY